MAQVLWFLSQVTHNLVTRALKENPHLLEVLKIYFDVMSEHSLAQKSTLFSTKAQEFGNLILTPKKYQVIVQFVMRDHNIFLQSISVFTFKLSDCKVCLLL